VNADFFLLTTVTTTVGFLAQGRFRFLQNRKRMPFLGADFQYNNIIYLFAAYIYIKIKKKQTSLNILGWNISIQMYVISPMKYHLYTNMYIRFTYKLINIKIYQRGNFRMKFELKNRSFFLHTHV